MRGYLENLSLRKLLPSPNKIKRLKSLKFYSTNSLYITLKISIMFNYVENAFNSKITEVEMIFNQSEVKLLLLPINLYEYLEDLLGYLNR
jgi:hypothetical protein